MRILYGVVGEGMGHATRSRVLIEHLLRRGHDVRVVVSGRAHRFLQEKFAGRAGITIQEIHGLRMGFEGNVVDKSETARLNLQSLPAGLLKNVEAYRRVAEDGFSPEMVVSDFESWAYLYGLNHRLPVVSIDNIQMINRCRHDPDVLGDDGGGAGAGFRLAKAFVKLKLPRAYHYLITSFFFPPVRKPYTTLVPPILRPELLAARREPGDHVLVYQTTGTNEALVDVLRRLPGEFRVYGMKREGREGNVHLRPFSERGFVDDLRTARAVIAGGGFSLMGEAVHLRVPMLSVPIEGQAEQLLNARYLQKLGYGAFARELTPDVLAAFLERIDDYAAALEAYTPRDNTLTFACLDELVRDVELDEPRPAVLEAPALGKYEGPPLPVD